MRNLIIALVGLNIFYFIWVLSTGNTTYTPPPRLEKGIPPIILLPATSGDAYTTINSKTRQKSHCYTLGPFKTEKTAYAIARKINKFGLTFTINKQKTKQTLNFLVYLQALASRKEAEEVAKDARKHKIKNITIIETGPYKNAIALGSFKDLEKARRHAEYVRFLGYDAKYTEQKKQKEVFWIDYDEPFGKSAPVIKWAKQVDPRANIRKIPKVCNK